MHWAHEGFTMWEKGKGIRRRQDLATRHSSSHTMTVTKQCGKWQKTNYFQKSRENSRRTGPLTNAGPDASFVSTQPSASDRSWEGCTPTRMDETTTRTALSTLSQTSQGQTKITWDSKKTFLVKMKKSVSLNIIRITWPKKLHKKRCCITESSPQIQDISQETNSQLSQLTESLF